MIIKESGIYKILNIITRDYYLGSAVNMHVRWGQHRRELRKNLRGNTHFQNAWNKYGEQAFEFSVVLLCDVKYNLYFEDWLIKLLNPAYNIAKDAKAPFQGRHHTEETRAKMSTSMKGKNLGKRRSEEIRAKMSEVRKGELNHNFGKRFSEATLEKMGKAQRGNTNALGRKHSEEVRAKNSEAAKKMWVLRRETKTSIRTPYD